MIFTTPARVCLFGDHQDYLGLPIIACAINRYMTLKAEPTSNKYFEIHLPDIGISRKIRFDEYLNEPLKPMDFFSAGMKVMQSNGSHPFTGYHITISSSIPINAGVSSSSALVVGWMHFLAKAFGKTQSPKASEIAQWAYEAEVVEHNSPGGKMDQYSIALGSVLYLETGDELHYDVFDKTIPGLILVESGIPKETLGTLSNVRGLTQEAIALIKEKVPDFNLEECDFTTANSLVTYLPERVQPHFLAAVENHEITKKALQILKGQNWDFERLGHLMHAHHSVLKNRLNVSHTKIDGFIEKAMALGAFGGKIVGSGGGGCAVIIAPEEKTHEIIRELKDLGAKAAYTINVSRGTHVEA